MIKRFATFFVFVLLASCGGQVKDGPPRRDVDVSGIPDAVPRHEPITRAGNKTPYTVLGKTYHVLPSFKGYQERGLASWYGSKFHGNPTSNGEPYDMYAMTAAHKTLPIPCYVQVTNLRNGRKTIVRVNDRGPFHDGRIIDLSYAAAKKLGVHEHGTAEVEVVAIDPAHFQPGLDYSNIAATRSPAPSRTAVAAVPERAASRLQGSAFLQVGAFSSRQAAEQYRRESLGNLEFPVEVRQAQGAGKPLYKVLLGPFSDHTRLAAAQDNLLRSRNMNSFVFLD